MVLKKIKILIKDQPITKEFLDCLKKNNVEDYYLSRIKEDKTIYHLVFRENGDFDYHYVPLNFYLEYDSFKVLSISEFINLFKGEEIEIWY